MGHIITNTLYNKSSHLTSLFWQDETTWVQLNGYKGRSETWSTEHKSSVRAFYYTKVRERTYVLIGNEFSTEKSNGAQGEERIFCTWQFCFPKFCTALHWHKLKIQIHSFWREEGLEYLFHCACQASLIIAIRIWVLQILLKSRSIFSEVYHVHKNVPKEMACIELVYRYRWLELVFCLLDQSKNNGRPFVRDILFYRIVQHLMFHWHLVWTVKCTWTHCPRTFLRIFGMWAWIVMCC